MSTSFDLMSPPSKDSSFSSSLFASGATSHNKLASLVVLCFFGVAAGVVLLSLCLVARLCHRAARSVHRKLTTDFRGDEHPSDVVPHTKRVYEIRAEEGCFASPPEPPSHCELPPPPPPSSFDRKRPSKSEEDGEGVDEEGCEAGGEEPVQTGSATRQKERMIHKDSVCATLFRPKLKLPPEMV